MTDPSLPRLTETGPGAAPRAPTHLSEIGMDPQVLADLILKAAYSVPQFDNEWMARRVHLPQQLVAEILEKQRAEQLLEVLGASGLLGYRYTVAQRGRERAQRLLELSGYIGPAPVSLANYTAFLRWQIEQAAPVAPQQVTQTVSQLALAPQAALGAGLALSSGRSLFLFGPPGNGKTTLGHLLHQALPGNIWVPHCLGIDHHMISVYDPQSHQSVEPPAQQRGVIDQRWVLIRRPFIVAGGEMTLHSCDLNYSPSMRSYQAPLHLKANGGIFLIDDFGRQRVEPHQLLNRWIIPLEHQIDYLTLITGQKIQVPFQLMLIVATNLKPESVTDAAFLRRMGYRLCLDRPTPELYEQIFRSYAGRHDAVVSDSLIAWLLQRYQKENRELRGCEPRDLIERARDICKYHGQSLELSEDILHQAWSGYFGTAI